MRKVLISIACLSVISYAMLPFDRPEYWAGLVAIVILGINESWG